MNEQFVNELATALRKVGALHGVGEEWVSYIGNIPAGGIPYCGQEVMRELYEDLWAYVSAQGLVKSEAEWQEISERQGGNVPFYSDGNGYSTFRLPKIVGYVKGANAQSESGAYLAEGLPNVTGAVGGAAFEGWTKASGALYLDPALYNVGATDGTGWGANQINLNASRSNPIYGNSEHVTPETSVVLFGVYAFGNISNVGTLDAANLATGLARLESNIGLTLKVW